MALIGFTVFKEKVLDGTKAQTIREPRKRPIRVGELLYLYWHLRRPDCELLKVVRCTEVFILKWGQMKDDLELAQRDGFDNLDDFRRWFARYNPDDETEFLVIRWDAAPKNTPLYTLPPLSPPPTTFRDVMQRVDASLPFHYLPEIGDGERR